MNRYVSLILLAPTLLLTAVGLRAEETAPAAAPAAAERRAGESCISLHRIQSTKVLDDRTILFELSGNETLVNRLPQRCSGLGFEKRFGYKTSISQLCSHDIIWVITSGAGGGIDRGASCGLGKFEPYVVPEEETPPKDEGQGDPGAM
jgi:hypothetical protein